MSVKTMGLVWDLDNNEIDREEKYVLLAYADHADHNGENMYPSIDLICKKTGYKERAAQMITRSLETKGFLIADGKGPKGTNKWRYGGGAKNAGVQNSTEGGAKPTVQGVQTDAPEPSEPPIKPSFDDVVEAANKKVDAYLLLMKSPGLKRQARIDSILSYIGGKLRINTETKRWKDFAKYIDDRQQNFSESVDVFVDWLTSQKGFDIRYWSPQRMMEMWPQAFAIELESEKVRLL